MEIWILFLPTPSLGIDPVWKPSKRKHLCLKHKTVERCREAIETVWSATNVDLAQSEGLSLEGVGCQVRKTLLWAGEAMGRFIDLTHLEKKREVQFQRQKNVSFCKDITASQL